MLRRAQLVLDGRAIDSEASLHRALADLLGFFEGYGHNLDALWDVLEDDALRRVKDPVEIVWQDAASFAQRHPDYFVEVQTLFEETQGAVSLRVTL